MRHRIALLALLAMVAAACAGSPTASDDTDGSLPSPETTGDEESPDGPGGLAAFFGWEPDDPEAAEAEYREQETAVQESIRQCMAEEGFDYQPVLPPESSFEAWDESDEEERVRTQGFGISTWYGNEEAFEGEAEEWVDPNQETLENMSEGERLAWDEALYGSQEEQAEGMVTEVDPETGDEMQIVNGFGTGCDGEARTAVYGDPAASQALWEDLQPAMDAMYEQVQADPRIVEADEAWAACMADAGYEYESRQVMHETIWEEFQPRLDEIVGPNGGYVDPFEGWTEDEINAFFEEKTQEEIDAFFESADNQRRTDIDQEALAALQQEEIDMAVADFECAEGYNELFQEVMTDYESDFIADHRDTLEQIREIEGG
jgi:hypothetical protein